MDEEQGLSSPIAGGIRGIRRSVSSSVFTGRAVAPPAPDPQVTSLLNQNSLTLTTVSSQLSNISEQVRGLNTSLLTIKNNLDLNDQLERRREQEKAKREAILAEQALREGKESELEKKIQFALLTPVRRVSRFAQGILGRLGNFLLILAGGWLVDKTLSLIRLSSEGNIDKLNEFKRKFLRDLLLLGGIGIGLTLGVGKIVATVGRLSGLALKLAFSGLIKAPFGAAIVFLRRQVAKFSKILLNQVGKVFTKGPAQLLKIFKIPLLGGLGAATLFPKQIMNFLRSITGQKIITGAVDDVAKTGAKSGARGFLRNVPIIGSIIDIGFGALDFNARRDEGETVKEAGLGAGGRTLGGLIPFLVGMTVFPEPASSIAGAVGLTILSIFGGMAGGKIGDELSGLNAKKRGQKPDQVEDAGGGNAEGTQTFSSEDVSTSFRSSDAINPINVKKELNVASAISNTTFEDSPEITYLPMGGAVNSGVPASSGASNVSSKTPSDSLPTIPSSDFANNAIALSESIFNVVV